MSYRWKKRVVNETGYYPTVMWNTDRAFAAAVAAYEENNCYIKQAESVISPEGELVSYKQPNRVLLLNFLLDQRVFTDEQVEKGKMLREHFSLLVLKKLGDTISVFENHALNIAGSDTIRSNEWEKLGVLASLPGVYQKNKQHEARIERREEIAERSKHVGRVGDRLKFEATVLTSTFSSKYNCYITNVLDEHNNIFLIFGETNYLVGSKMQLAGSVKRHLEGNVTQLNRVRVLKNP